MTEENAASLIDRYCTAWKPMPAAERHALLSDILCADVRYIDPTVNLQTLESLVAHIDRVVTKRPNALVVRSSEIDFHNQHARIAWNIVDGEKRHLEGSIDVIRFDATTDKIDWIIGFFGATQPVAG